MEIRSRAPLRVGLAGGGTDLLTFSHYYGGATLNATIGLYAYCSIMPRDDNMIRILSYDNKNDLLTPSVPELPIENEVLILHKGVYNRIVKEFNNGKPLSFTMVTANDAPIGSGLGTSSTMIVAIIEAFDKWLGLGIKNYQKAQLAYEIERVDLHYAGGKQDQYAAVFGGFNLMEYRMDDSVIVNKLSLDKDTLNELECSLLLYYGGQSRKSADIQLQLSKNIISHQHENLAKKNTQAINAMLKLKTLAYDMKDCILKSDYKGFTNCLSIEWENKKKTSSIISNVQLEETIDYARHNGADAIKVSGAGGGGFLLLHCAPENRQKLMYAMQERGGLILPVKFSKNGVESWTID